MFKDREALTTALNDYYGVARARLERFQNERREADRCEAARFTVFDYINPDENHLSDIIHDLLDPFGKHGQGTLFLNLFLEAIGISPDAVHPPFGVKREDRTLYCTSSQRRIDVTLELGDFGIGIENKPWDPEGENQLEDYSRHLRRKYGERFMLVYLSGDGSGPARLNKTDLAKLRAAKQFKRLAYPTDLHSWLRRCCNDCEAERVRWFIRDFAEYVKKSFELVEAGEEPIHEAD